MFTLYDQYLEFAKSVRNVNRYYLQAAEHEFLDAFKSELERKSENLPRSTHIFRSVDDYDFSNFQLQPSPPERFAPDPNRVTEGRLNAKGIPVLYCSSLVETAISEIRPWVGSKVSVATLSTNYDLKIVNLSQNLDSASGMTRLNLDELLGGAPVSPEKANLCVWTDIDNAFSKPATRSDNSLDYIPTQILAECIKHNGFHGVKYKSAFGGDQGYNIALFGLDWTNVIETCLYEVNSVEINVNQISPVQTIG